MAWCTRVDFAVSRNRDCLSKQVTARRLHWGFTEIHRVPCAVSVVSLLMIYRRHSQVGQPWLTVSFIESWQPFLFLLFFFFHFFTIYISFLSREVKSQRRDVSNLSSCAYTKLPLGHAASCFLRIYATYTMYSLDYERSTKSIRSFDRSRFIVCISLSWRDISWWIGWNTIQVSDNDI